MKITPTITFQGKAKLAPKKETPTADKSKERPTRASTNPINLMMISLRLIFSHLLLFFN